MRGVPRAPGGQTLLGDQEVPRVARYQGTAQGNNNFGRFSVKVFLRIYSLVSLKTSATLKDFCIVLYLEIS